MHNHLYCCGSMFWFSASMAYYLGWQIGGSLARCIIELQLSVNVIRTNFKVAFSNFLLIFFFWHFNPFY